MLKCHEVSRLVSTDDLAELGLMQKLEFKLHLMMCVHCKRYVQQIRAIGRGARHLASHSEADPQQLERMENQVLEEINGVE